MAKCGTKLDRTPYVCAHEGVEQDGRCCSSCSSSGGHTPECYIRCYPGELGAEYLGLSKDEMELRLLERLTPALLATKILEKELRTINRLIWDLNSGHRQHILQSLLHHLEIDLQYIGNEIKRIAS